MENGCECADCKKKQKAQVEVLNKLEARIDEECKKNLYTVGIPRSKIKILLDEVRRDLQ